MFLLFYITTKNCDRDTITKMLQPFSISGLDQLPWHICIGDHCSNIWLCRRSSSSTSTSPLLAPTFWFVVQCTFYKDKIMFTNVQMQQCLKLYFLQGFMLFSPKDTLHIRKTFMFKFLAVKQNPRICFTLLSKTYF